MDWRPNKKEWAHQRSRYFEQNQPKPSYRQTRQKDYEAGADAAIKALFKLAEESPTKTLTIESRVVNVFTEEIK